MSEVTRIQSVVAYGDPSAAELLERFRRACSTKIPRLGQHRQGVRPGPEEYRAPRWDRAGLLGQEDELCHGAVATVAKANNQAAWELLGACDPGLVRLGRLLT